MPRLRTEIPRLRADDEERDTLRHRAKDGTVLGNVQVVLVGLLAWALLGERPDRSSLAAIPIVGLGVVLISGALEQGAYGSNPQLGAIYGVLTGIAYAGFLLVLRHGSKDLRRPAGPLFTATLSSTICCAAIGAARFALSGSDAVRLS